MSRLIEVDPKMNDRTRMIKQAERSALEPQRSTAGARPIQGEETQRHPIAGKFNAYHFACANELART